MTEMIRLSLQAAVTKAANKYHSIYEEVRFSWVVINSCGLNIDFVGAGPFILSMVSPVRICKEVTHENLAAENHINFNKLFITLK
jgi:hypothetical protein